MTTTLYYKQFYSRLICYTSEHKKMRIIKCDTATATNEEHDDGDPR